MAEYAQACLVCCFTSARLAELRKARGTAYNDLLAAILDAMQGAENQEMFANLDKIGRAFGLPDPA